MKVRSAGRQMVEKSTGLLKVTVIALGVMVTVAPLAGLVDDDSQQVDGVDAR